MLELKIHFLIVFTSYQLEGEYHEHYDIVLSRAIMIEIHFSNFSPKSHREYSLFKYIFDLYSEITFL